MPVTTQEIAQERHQGRKSVPHAEHRIANALEQISDTLEAINRNLIEYIQRPSNPSGKG